MLNLVYVALKTLHLNRLATTQLENVVIVLNEMVNLQCTLFHLLPLSLLCGANQVVVVMQYNLSQFKH